MCCVVLCCSRGFNFRHSLDSFFKKAAEEAVGEEEDAGSVESYFKEGSFATEQEDDGEVVGMFVIYDLVQYDFVLFTTNNKQRFLK
jgi:hypothetical protein